MESNILFFLLLFDSTTLIFISHLASAVKALKEIGNKIGKKDWDFGVDPCNGKGKWNVSDSRKGFESSFNHNSSCHVISFEGSGFLVELSFMGNKLSGPFPKVLTNITTLKNLSNIHSCLERNFPCMSNNPRHYSLHIGNEANVNGNIYKADTERKGASMLYITEDWALSSTGSFMDNDIDNDRYIVANTSRLLNVSAMNSKARVSPLSLTYYGLCMINGKYTVKLHFAEITFINDRSFNSIGRRIFDVYIQVQDVGIFYAKGSCVPQHTR